MTLRELTPDDLTDLRNWWEDEDTRRYCSEWPAGWAIQLAQRQDGVQRRGLLNCDEAGVPVVLLDVHLEWVGEATYAHLAWCTDPNRRRQGHATAALAVLRELPWMAGVIWQATIDDGNTASVSLARRAGMELTGTLGGGVSCYKRYPDRRPESTMPMRPGQHRVRVGPARSERR